MGNRHAEPPPAQPKADAAISARPQDLVQPITGNVRDQGGTDHPRIAIDTSHLPGDLRSDPMDRLIIATARHLGMPIVTADRKIIAYAEAGFVRVIPC
jgi:hypothetical protein